MALTQRSLRLRGGCNRQSIKGSLVTFTVTIAVLFWSASSDMVVERNLLVNCYQGIAFGNASHGSGDHSGGIVRNNFIYASMPHDVVVEMVHATGWLVAHNTALLLDPAPGLTWSMEARFADSQGTFAYNLTNMDIWPDRDGAQGTSTRNVTNAQSGWFVNPAGGDLHLLATATAAIDQAAPLAQVSDDYDGSARPSGSAPDVGADEYSPPPEWTSWVYLPLVMVGHGGAAPEQDRRGGLRRGCGCTPIRVHPGQRTVVRSRIVCRRGQAGGARMGGLVGRIPQGMEFSRNGCRNGYGHGFETVVCYTADVCGWVHPADGYTRRMGTPGGHSDERSRAMDMNRKSWHSAYVAVGPLLIAAACFLGLVLERNREFCFLAGAFWSLVAAGCISRYYVRKSG